MQEQWWEKPTCFLCDYGLYLLVFLLVLLVAIWRWRVYSTNTEQPHGMQTEAPVLHEEVLRTSTPTVMARLASPVSAVQSTATSVSPTPSIPTPQPTATATPPPANPQYIMAFVPLNWQSGMDEFEKSAQEQADLFIQSSGMDAFFEVQVQILPEGLTNADLTSRRLPLEIVDAVMQDYPADRYIGLTDGDLCPQGQCDVSGWVNSGLPFAVVAENASISVTAHELGHTFGLCDEYSYTYWLEQQQEMPGGCPNPYPPSCEKNTLAILTCAGQPSADGRYSIMGISGLPGEYAFNEASKRHLQDIFRQLAEAGIS